MAWGFPLPPVQHPYPPQVKVLCCHCICIYYPQWHALSVSWQHPNHREPPSHSLLCTCSCSGELSRAEWMLASGKCSGKIWKCSIWLRPSPSVKLVNGFMERWLDWVTRLMRCESLLQVLVASPWYDHTKRSQLKVEPLPQPTEVGGQCLGPLTRVRSKSIT